MTFGVTFYPKSGKLSKHISIIQIDYSKVLTIIVV